MTTKAETPGARLNRRPDARRRATLHALRLAAILAVVALVLFDHLARAA